MADPWISHEAGRSALEEVSEAWGRDVVALCRDQEALGTTELVQPALFACDIASFRVLEAEGVEFTAVAGHSLGEYVALVAAGAVDLPAAFRAVLERGRAMQESSEAVAGGMTALIGLAPDAAAEVCRVAGRGDVLEVANENAPKQIVLSGSLPALERAEELARARGAKAIRLRVAGAFHSPLMRPALDRVREAIARMEFREPRLAVVPNASGRPTRQPAALRDLLSRHLVSSVRWERSIRAMADAGIEGFVEAGPGDVLSKLVRRIVPGTAVWAAGSPESAAAVARFIDDDQPADLEPVTP